MSLQYTLKHEKVFKMFIKKYFDNIANDFDVGLELRTRILKCDSGNISVQIDNLMSLQGYALTRFLNAEYNSFRGNPLMLNVGDPSIQGYAEISDDETEIVTLKIPKLEFDSFREFLELRRDDIKYLLTHASISKYLKHQEWNGAKKRYTEDLQVT